MHTFYLIYLTFEFVNLKSWLYCLNQFVFDFLILYNFYILEEAVRQIEKDITMKKYTNFVGIQNGKYRGFGRVYVLATEIVAYTDNKINGENLERYLQAYQTKKTLNMEQIWNTGVFLQIAIITNIAEICEKIYKFCRNSKWKIYRLCKSLCVSNRTSCIHR